MTASQLSPELRALMRKHPLPRRSEGDRILKGDLGYGAGRYADAATNGASDLWAVFLAIESERGHDIGKSVSLLAPPGRLMLARWCFSSGRVDVGLSAFESIAGMPDAGVEDDDLMEYLEQVEATRGEGGYVEAADALLEKTGSQRVLHALVRALSSRGDLVGAQTRLAKHGDASSTMAGSLRAEDLRLPGFDEPTPRDAPTTTRDIPRPPALRDPPATTRDVPPRPPAPALRDPPATTRDIPPARAPVPAPTPKANHPVIGQLVGGTFQINGFVCEGRIAQLFSATRDKVPRHVALKVMLPTFAEDAEAARQFQAAAARAMKLDHSSIVAVLAAGEDRGWQYVATEMVFGENLASYVQTRGPLAEGDALRIALEITKALEHAYAKGVVHGGLRPSNVFITRDIDAPEIEHVRVADFGMAEVVAATRPLDGFTSPEQAREAPAGPASDVYGVGALLHFMLTGSVPFGDRSGEALRQAILREKLPREEDVPTLGPSVVSLFTRVLTKEAGKRLASASELAAALTALSRHVAAEAVALASGPKPSDETADELTVTTQRTGKHSALASDHPLVGQVLDGRFRVVSFMRAGGMAQLYHGTQSSEPRQVAIKVMHPVFASEPEIVKRFAREARLAAKLDHPNIVRLIHVGDDPAPLPTSGRTLLYIAMEILAGEDLAVRMKQRGRLAELQAAEIAVDVTSALAYAHALGVVHRDIKPANVMMCTGELRERVKLLDFGIAKVLDKPTQTSPGGGLTMNRTAITTVGDLVGTPRYMSPEQGRAEPVDHRADLYSLGVVLYELVTGAVPFDGETALQIIARHVQDEPAPPRRAIPDLHPDLDRLILDLLRKDPAAR
ncbi:MAG: serine/threonine protein kinase, partial [Myxococcales bacterium]|nr:serine/threonine protein kinase [Myxococcales bacterium]